MTTARAAAEHDTKSDKQSAAVDDGSGVGVETWVRFADINARISCPRDAHRAIQELMACARRIERCHFRSYLVVSQSYTSPWSAKGRSELDVLCFNAASPPCVACYVDIQRRSQLLAGAVVFEDGGDLLDAPTDPLQPGGGLSELHIQDKYHWQRCTVSILQLYETERDLPSRHQWADFWLGQGPRILVSHALPINDNVFACT